MSIESAIQNLADAINTLAAAHTPANGVPSPDKPSPETEARTRKPRKPRSKPAAEKTTKKAEETANTEEAEASGEPNQPTTTIDDVRGAIINLVNTLGRDVGVDLLSKYSAAKVGDVKPEDYAALHSDINAALEGASS